mgnify:CR=1 FL=1
MQIYLLDISIWYTVWSALLGGLIGAKDRLGEVLCSFLFSSFMIEALCLPVLVMDMATQLIAILLHDYFLNTSIDI